jgi:polyphosphate kinase
VNGLTDPEVIDALYQASAAGTRIELIVRGLCSLRPGVPGLSESISVRSIVGRFLEHSRIYRFGNPGTETGTGRSGRRAEAIPAETGDPRYFIGSADLMERNLDRRVEVLAPVLDAELRGRLDETLELNLADDVSTWELAPNGEWHRVPSLHGISTQKRLQDLAVERSRKRRSSEMHS